ncbi:diguanylate cyclase [Fulvimarina sp. MAC3]|uniref:GGDEF domain-containing protein n=1 Tax=Fulvimarina sp. MAC3 TaxID=3148887 RepID=UPI0031FC27BE
MLFDIEIIFVLIRGTALLSLVALFYGFVSDMGGGVMPRGPAVGLAFGFAAVLTMSDPFVLGDGVIIDARGVILVLAAPFGGLSAALVSGIIASLYRLWLGGAGAPIGVTVIVAAVAIGALCSRYVKQSEGGYDFRELLAFAIFGSLQSFLLLLIPLLAPNIDPMRALFPHVAANFLGILILGHFLTGVGRRRYATKLFKREALTDPLTELPNRRAFDQAVQRMTAKRGEKGGIDSVALLLIDIDHFKQVNDKWGHVFGDRILRSVAHTILRHARREDLVARYGGEEIAIILPAISQFEACKLAERIRLAIEAANQRFEITASIGVAVADDDNRAFRELFQAADRALYQAKERGRNRIELEYLKPAMHPEMPDEPETYAERAALQGRRVSSTDQDRADRSGRLLELMP